MYLIWGFKQKSLKAGYAELVSHFSLIIATKRLLPRHVETAVVT